MIWAKEETMSRAEIEAIQLSRLKDTVNRVYEKVPAYRAKMEEAGVRPEHIQTLKDLQKLPFVTKQDMRDNYPYGLFAVPKKELRRIHASSGTTGKPTVVGYTENDLLPVSLDTAELKRLEARAQKLKTRLQNLIEMRADGELSKEEFMSQKSEIAEQLQAIESQRTTVPVQNCLIDFTQPKLDEMLLDKVVDRVIPITNDHFRWELNLLSGEHNAVECSIKGRKNKVSVSIEETVRSDTLSNIFSEKIAPTGGPLDRPPSRTPAKGEHL